jgi:hypothetical protein
MKQRMLSVLVVFLFIFGLSSPGFGQRQTGSIHGTITDKEKNPLPGATVSIVGVALMGSRDYVTSATGLFRFPALLSGEYELRAEMPGFKTQVRKSILVSIGKTTEVNIDLEVADVEEEVVMSSVTRVVDVESSKMSVNYGSPFLTRIPMNRNLYDIQNSIPGAVSEDIEYFWSSSILGGTVRDQVYAMDGVPMNDPATFFSMVNLNVDVYDEIEFEVGGHPAEVGQAGSTYINIVTKSGGNKLSGSGTFYYTGKSLCQDLLTPQKIKFLNVNPPEKYTDSKDFSFNIGGPFLKDRAWFFLDGRRLTWSMANSQTPETRMARLGLTDSPHYDLEHQEWMGFAKLTIQPTKEIHYMGLFNFNQTYEPIYQNSIDPDVAYDNAQELDHENAFSTTHQINLILDQNTYIDVRGTYVYHNTPIHSLTQNQYTYFDNQQKIWWGAAPYNDETRRIKLLGSASITRYEDDLFGANHELKAGAEYEQSETHRDWYRANPYYSYWYDWAAGNPYYVDGKSIGRLKIRPCPPSGGAWDVQDDIKRFSGYVQDNIVIGRLALNLGVRFDYSFQYEPEQTRPQLQYNVGPELLSPDLKATPNALIGALSNLLHSDNKISPLDSLTMSYKDLVKFTTFSPRFGAVYDLFGNGKTALKLSFSRTFEPIWTEKYSGGQIFRPTTVQWNWYDLNQNGYMDLPGVDKYVLISYPEQNPKSNYYEFTDKNGTTTKLKPPYTDEVIAGIEHEIARDFKLGLQFLWKRNRNLVEDIDIINGYDPNATDDIGPIWLPFKFTDPGWDQTFGTADDQTLTIYGLRSDRPAPEWKGTNPPEAERNYWALIFTFDKRMSDKWQLKGSVLYSSFKGNVDAGYDATGGESGMFNDPNMLINAYGPLYFDRPLQIKIMGTYLLPWDFAISAYFQYHSGSPWVRTLARVYFPKNYMGFGTRSPYYSVNAEPLGTERGPSYANLDIRVEKVFKIGNSAKLDLYVDIFNLGGESGIVTNEDPMGILRYDYAIPTYSLSTTYGQASSVYGVRSVRIGARISF